MNFISAFNELDKLYEAEDCKVVRSRSSKRLKESMKNLDEAAAGVRLTPANLSFIDDLADELGRFPKGGDLSYIKKFASRIDPEITVDDLSIAAEQSDYPKAVKRLAAHMKAKGFKNFGDYTKSLEDIKESLTEADEEILVDEEPIVDDEAVEEPVEADDKETVDVNDYVLECSKCGALVIKAIKEVTEDEESGLANVGEECAYCEASDGFKILGTFAPYQDGVAEEESGNEDDEVIEIIDDEEPIEEGIFGFGKKKKQEEDEPKKSTRVSPWKDSDYVYITYNNASGKYNYGGFNSANQTKSEAQQKLNHAVKMDHIKKDDAQVVTYGEAKKIVGRKIKDDSVIKKESLDEQNLEEGVFDKKGSAKYNNEKRAFETSVSQACDGKSLRNIANDMSNLLKDAIEHYKLSEIDEANHETAQSSMEKVFTKKAEQIIKLYEEMIKTFKKPNNFNQAANVIKRSISTIVGSYAGNCDAAKDITEYIKMLGAVDKVSTDKAIKKEAFKDFYKVLIYKLSNDLAMFKKAPKHTLFESVDTDKEELEELFNANVNIDAKDFAGSNNNVSVLGLGEDLDEEELEELFDANLNIDAKGFGGTGNAVDVL